MLQTRVDILDALIGARRVGRVGGGDLGLLAGSPLDRPRLGLSELVPERSGLDEGREESAVAGVRPRDAVDVVRPETNKKKTMKSGKMSHHDEIPFRILISLSCQSFYLVY